MFGNTRPARIDPIRIKTIIQYFFSIRSPVGEESFKTLGWNFSITRFQLGLSILW